MADFKGDGKAIFAVFIGAIIAATLIVAIADQVNLTTNTFNVDNVTVVVPAVNATLDLTGRGLVTRVFITNTSSTNASNLINIPQLTLQTGTGTNGLRSVQLFTNDSSTNDVGNSVNVSYTYEPDGYISDVSGRAVTNLILLFGALAILIFVIVIFIRDGTLGKMIRNERLN